MVRTQCTSETMLHMYMCSENVQCHDMIRIKMLRMLEAAKTKWRNNVARLIDESFIECVNATVSPSVNATVDTHFSCVRICDRAGHEVHIRYWYHCNLSGEMLDSPWKDSNFHYVFLIKPFLKLVLFSMYLFDVVMYFESLRSWGAVLFISQCTICWARNISELWCILVHTCLCNTLPLVLDHIVQQLVRITGCMHPLTCSTYLAGYLRFASM